MGLFWKIFLSFGAAMAVTLVATVYVSFQLASEAFYPVNVEGRDRIVLEAAEALSSGGERSLRQWLRLNSRTEAGMVLLIVEEDGEELLDRALPREMRRFLNLRRPGRRGDGDRGDRDGRRRDDGDPDGDRDGDPDGDPDEDATADRSETRDARRTPGAGRPPNLRPMQLTPHLVAPDGEEYRLLFVRAPITVFGMLAWPSTRLAVGAIAILVAAVTSMLLARYIAAPIARLQRASRALAAGDLATRVGSRRQRWTDEVGVLAQDFDAMAERIQALVTNKETLLRDVSHELRSPLARLRVALALAQRRADDAAQPDLARMEREAERLDELIGQIMTLARLRTQQEPVRESLRFDALVSEIVDDARYEYPDARVDFHSAGRHEIHGDPRSLKSAVENVVRNAIIHAGEGGPIAVDLTAEHGALSLRVRDRGPGVEEGDLARIFDPLYRGDPSRDHQLDGQGLGLAITARVIELHGGQVTASNRAGGGLEIHIRLPAGA